MRALRWALALTGLLAMAFVAAPRGAAAPATQELSAAEVRATTDQARARGDEMAIGLDTPRASQPVSGWVPVAGWAVDLRPDGPGVDPDSFQLTLGADPDAPVLGAPRGIVARPDVAQILGKPRETTRGFAIGWQTCTFAPGIYRLSTSGAALGSVATATTSIDVNVAPCPDPPGAALMADPLDGSIRQWTVGRFPDCAFEHAGGEYVVTTRPTSPFRACGDPDDFRTVYGDFALDLDFRLLNPSPTAEAEIQFRAVSTVAPAPRWYAFTSGYALRLRPGRVMLVYDEELSFVPLADLPTDVVAGENGDNHVRIEANGPRVRILVNDQNLLEFEDDRPPWGMISLGAAAPAGGGATVAYRNLVVSRLP